MSKDRESVSLVSQLRETSREFLRRRQIRAKQTCVSISLPFHSSPQFLFILIFSCIHSQKLRGQKEERKNFATPGLSLALKENENVVVKGEKSDGSER